MADYKNLKLGDYKLTTKYKFVEDISPLAEAYEPDYLYSVSLSGGYSLGAWAVSGFSGNAFILAACSTDFQSYDASLTLNFLKDETNPSYNSIALRFKKGKNKTNIQLKDTLPVLGDLIPGIEQSVRQYIFSIEGIWSSRGPHNHNIEAFTSHLGIGPFISVNYYYTPEEVIKKLTEVGVKYEKPDKYGYGVACSLATTLFEIHNDDLGFYTDIMVHIGAGTNMYVLATAFTGIKVYFRSKVKD